MSHHTLYSRAFNRVQSTIYNSEQSGRGFMIKLEAAEGLSVHGCVLAGVVIWEEREATEAIFCCSLIIAGLSLEND